jgi:hypothetical protein
MNATPIQNAIHNITGPELSPLGKLVAKKLRRMRPEPVADVDPRAELRRLVGLHKRWTRAATSWVQSVSDRKWTDPDTKEKRIIKCTLPDSIRADVLQTAKALAKEAERLEADMLRELRKVHIYKHFLKNVFGCGTVTSAYLVVMVDIRKAEKVSNLIRYCGNACDPATGKREIRHSGPKANGGDGTYNDELKMRIWQAMVAMRKNGAKKTAGAPHGKTTKYLTRWTDAVHFRSTTGREQGADHAGRRKATDLFLWDLYVVWRTLEGLPVWPDKYSAMRGYVHGGAPCVNAPRVYTLDEALAEVGFTGGLPLQQFVAQAAE